MKAKGNYDTFHVSLLKPFKQDNFNRFDKPLPPIRLKDGEDQFEVEENPSIKDNPRKTEIPRQVERLWQPRKYVAN